MPVSTTRDEAVAILAGDQLAKMSPGARAEQLECMMGENWDLDSGWRHISADVRRELGNQSEIKNPADPRYDALLLLSLKERFVGATNGYLSGLLAGLGHEYGAVVGAQPELIPCPCCGLRSLGERGGYEICRVCWWEDDGQDNRNAGRVMGGPNYRLSLTQGRINFLRSGISDPERTDLQDLRDPAAKYAQGRVFVLSSDGCSVTEPAAGWQGAAAKDEGGR